jgi:tRNA (cytidine/uridine-2'-O-)-methyltransferase
VNIVLVEPEIPPNTGNVARLCAATRARLHLVGPLGFRLDDSTLKRAGMDYWRQVDWRTWDDWATFEAALSERARLWLVEQGGARQYDEAVFEPEDFIVFGRETAGLPPALMEKFPEQALSIPMFNTESRSLNLANSVSVVLYEALRQQGFKNSDS